MSQNNPTREFGCRWSIEEQKSIARRFERPVDMETFHRHSPNTFQIDTINGYTTLWFYHETCILRRTQTENGAMLTFDSGGHRTYHTKRKMNALQDEVSVYQEKKVWYINWGMMGAHTVKFFDGITFNIETGEFSTEDE